MRLVAVAAIVTALGGASSWTPLQPALSARTEVTAARIGDVVYVFGGFDERTRASTSELEGYDVRTNSWRELRRGPLPLNHAEMTAYRGSLYLLGGYAGAGDTSAGAVRSFFRYSPSQDRWFRLRPAPTPRAAFAIGVVGTKLYAAGGRNDLQTLSSTDVYDFRTHRWSRGPSLHVTREHVAGTVAAGAFYTLGGRLNGHNLDAVERLRPGHRWQRMPALRVARSGDGAVTVGDEVIVVGGEGPQGTIAQVERFDPRTGRWSFLAPMRTPRHGLGAAAANGFVYALEGGPQPGLTFSRVAERLRVSR